jgi:hypothetical protein
MYISYGTLWLLCLTAVVIWFWHDSLRARDIANAAAMTACERIGLQFLDGTAAFARLRLVRDSGRLRLRRTYVFDYTAQSIERRQGFAILLGMDVEYVGFAPEHSAQPALNDSDDRGSTSPDTSQNTAQPVAKVVDFETRRAQRAAS